MSELVDIVNEDNIVIWSTSLDEVHQQWLLHKSVHVFLINNAWEVFCRKRSKQKARYPWYYSTSIGHHVYSWENYMETALHTTKTLLWVNEPKLECIWIFRIHDAQENEINTLYTCRYDWEIYIKGDYFSAKSLVTLWDKKCITPHLKESISLYLHSISHD